MATIGQATSPRCAFCCAHCALLTVTGRHGAAYASAGTATAQHVPALDITQHHAALVIHTEEVISSSLVSPTKEQPGQNVDSDRALFISVPGMGQT